MFIVEEPLMEALRDSLLLIVEVADAKVLQSLQLSLCTCLSVEAIELTACALHCHRVEAVAPSRNTSSAE